MKKELTNYEKYELKYWRTNGLKKGVEGNAAWQKQYLDRMNTVCQIPESSNIAMDVGSGPFGGMSLVYPAIRWILVDGLNSVYKNMVTQNPGFEYLECFGEDISVENGIVDIVFCINALDHTVDRRKTLEEIYRVLKPGGIFGLCVHCRKLEELNEGHQQSFTPPELAAEIHNIGFTKCDYITYVFGYMIFAGVIIK